MRQRFMLLHAAMTASFVLYTFTSSNLVFSWFPDLSLSTRINFTYGTLAVGVGIAGFFTLAFLEKGLIGRRLTRAVQACSLLLFANAAFIVVLGDTLPFLSRNIYHAAYLPIILVYLVVVATALRRGTRAVWFLVGGWSLTAIFAMERIFRGLDLYILPAEADFSLYFGLGMEAVVTALGVADRMMIVRRERDRAREERRMLARLADTDGLTSLANRRAFDDALAERPKGALAILDLDRFKAVNDTLGHHVGDDVLRTVGSVLHAAESNHRGLRAFRLGGEEFALLIPARNGAEARLIVESLRQAIPTAIMAAIPALGPGITASAGIAMIGAEDRVGAYAAADTALYEAKHRGRDRTAFAGEAVPASTLGASA
jgi:diguanylate cyclase (GGDEF)-like protein